MKRSTLQKELSKKIALFVIAMMALILGTMAVMMTNALQRELQQTMATEAFHIEEVLENYLAFQKENVANLAGNDFIINSLVDISGREKYLPPLMNGFLKSRKVAAITVVDYEGKIIRSSMESPPAYLLTTGLRAALEGGRSCLELSAERKRILFIEPILFYQTPQGAVIVDIDLGTFASQAMGSRQQISYRIFQQGRMVFEKKPSPGDYLTVSHRFSPASKYLRQLGLSLEIGTQKASYLNLVKNLIIRLSLLTAIFLILSLLLAAKVARGLAKPILALCERVKADDIFTCKTYGPLGTNNELEDLAAAFDERNQRLNTEMEERYKAEKQSALAFERFKTVMDSIDALVYVADMETYELLFINEYGQRIWGDSIGKICWQQLQQGQNGPCLFCTNDKLLDPQGNPTGVLVWESQNSVDRRWYQCRDQAIRWTDNRFVRMEIAVDITARKEIETALADEKEQLAVTLRSIGDGVITTDTSGRIVLINKVAEELTGWSQQEAAGRQLAEVFSIINEKTRQSCENPVENVMASGSVVALTNHTVLVARDGRERSIADSGAPIRDRQSRIIGAVLVFRDVTEALRMEEQIVKTMKLESVGVVAGGIAHDFNNILTAILGNLNLAMIDDTLPRRTKGLLAAAEKASIRAKDLTQQLLTFSKGGEPIKQTASINEIIRDSANFILHGSNIACHFAVPEDLWLAEVDKGQISQVIQNLILNAKQAMPMGGSVKISCENVNAVPDGILLPQNRSYIKICISDSGVGVKEEIIDKIFDPYFTTKKEGSGLGLAVTHSIISKHDGHISVQSKPGAGTTFTIFLPAEKASLHREETAKEDNIRESKSARIMVMDDDDQIRDLSKAMLSSLGHEVVLAKDGDEAIKTYEACQNTENPIDVVIMDLTIAGGMGGKEAIQKVIELDPKAKVIVSSGYSNDPILANFKDYGFCSAIVKPFRLMDLSKVLRQILG